MLAFVKVMNESRLNVPVICPPIPIVDIVAFRLNA